MEMLALRHPTERGGPPQLSVPAPDVGRGDGRGRRLFARLRDGQRRFDLTHGRGAGRRSFPIPTTSSLRVSTSSYRSCAGGEGDADVEGMRSGRDRIAGLVASARLVCDDDEDDEPLQTSRLTSRQLQIASACERLRSDVSREMNELERHWTSTCTENRAVASLLASTLVTSSDLALQPDSTARGGGRIPPPGGHVRMNVRCAECARSSGQTRGRSAPVLISENKTIRWDGRGFVGSFEAPVVVQSSSPVVGSAIGVGRCSRAIKTLSPWQRSRRGGTNRVPTTGARLQRIADDGRGGAMATMGETTSSSVPPSSYFSSSPFPPPPPDSNDGDDPWAPGWTKGRTIPIVVGRREFASVDPNVASPLPPPSLNDHDDDDAVPVGMEQERPTGTASRRPTTARVPLPPRTAGKRP